MQRAEQQLMGLRSLYGHVFTRHNSDGNRLKSSWIQYKCLFRYVCSTPVAIDIHTKFFFC